MANNSKLRIAVLGLRGIPNVQGGVETHCEALYPRLAANGYNITLFARKGYVPSKDYLFKDVHVVPLWTFRKKNLEAILHTLYGIFYVVFHKKSYDLLHVHGIGPSLLIPIARLFGIPVVMTHHGPDYDRKKWGAFARKILRVSEVSAVRFATEIITVSKHIRSYLKKRFNRESTYIPNGVNLPDILPPAGYLEKYDLTSRRYILAVGRLVPEKGFHDLLEAYKNLETDCKLVIVGDADHEDKYSRTLKEQSKTDNRIIMTGFIKGKELQEIFSNAGLFVLPSYHEGLPIVLLEAMSYNLRILVSDIPANQELAEPDETFPVGDIAALRSKLQYVLQHGFSSQERERVRREFNWDTIAANTEMVYWRATTKRQQTEVRPFADSAK